MALWSIKPDTFSWESLKNLSHFGRYKNQIGVINIRKYKRISGKKKDSNLTFCVFQVHRQK